MRITRPPLTETTTAVLPSSSTDLGLTVCCLALLKPADGAAELDLGIDELRRLLLIPRQERLEGVAHEPDVLLRHRRGGN